MGGEDREDKGLGLGDLAMGGGVATESVMMNFNYSSNVPQHTITIYKEAIKQQANSNKAGKRM